MIETLTTLAIIFHTSAIGLGVGSSTLAITSFLVALIDGTIDPTERRMLGVIYGLLRFAMVSILVMTIFIVWQRPDLFGSQTIFLWILIAVLYINAILMTLHWIPSKFGPAIQAATWYTLGFVTTIHMFQLYEIGFGLFLLLYAGDFIFAFVVVNGFLAWRKHQLAKQ